uniref:Uncharacterized protein n=1 Tax=Chromera velia CCMP2878 TaxID=1169474 RepID=A0A0G4IGB4_9ALVE|eukprot:Cvel_142.t1-p1 / transcript=Cvel_142.t1 / gene=Cvel_142 / organism=Chromera_velia_CCMP2878 / gene_product=hypothetical protein / transcript_product=hypothetical protein / location=Cvel_scaffold9:240414-243191(-) / protein_length=119 / sequence_SO=supercontig / SO=protein_coding / is_pseudo=false
MCLLIKVLDACCREKPERRPTARSALADLRYSPEAFEVADAAEALLRTANAVNDEVQQARDEVERQRSHVNQEAHRLSQDRSSLEQDRQRLAGDQQRAEGEREQKKLKQAKAGKVQLPK